MTAQEEHLAAEIALLKKENELMKKIATTDGFYRYYFSLLPIFNTNIEAFNQVNEMYYNFFKEYKYSSYDSFRRQIKIYIKK